MARPASDADVDAFLQDMKARGARVIEYTSKPAETIEQSRDPNLIYGASSPADAVRRANARRDAAPPLPKR